MRVGIIGIVVVGLVFLGSSFCMANGGGPVTEKVTQAAVGTGVSKAARTTGTAVKSPGTATLLSVLCPGLGQIYNDDSLTKAIIMGGVEGLCWVLIGASDMEGVGYFGLAMGRVVSSVDAYYTAVEKNNGLSLKIDNEKVLLAVKADF